MLRLNPRLCGRAGLLSAVIQPTGRLLKRAVAPDAAEATKATASSPSADADKTVQVSADKAAPPPDPVMDGLPPLPDPPRHAVRAFPRKGPRGNFTPEYYVGTAGAAGHPDLLAEQLGAGRPDAEWMWLKLLCFICFMSTVGTWVYGVFFPQHMKFFQDEPWSRLPKSAL